MPICARSSRERGISLIELIMFIVIVGIALAGIMLVINQVSGHSADALMRKQALAAADALLEEIESQHFSGVFGGAATQANRPSFDSIFNYNGFATSGILPADGTATAVSGLSNYQVAVTVSASALGNILAARAAQITVTVTDPAGQSISLSGYRTNY